MASRPLTQGEEEIVKDIFRGSVDYTKVKIHDEAGVFFQPNNTGFTPCGEVYTTGVFVRPDYSGMHVLYRGFLVHEMVHVWQYQNQVFPINVVASFTYEMARHGLDRDAAYPYVLDDSRDLMDYYIEQQAAIIEDYYRVVKAGDKPRYTSPPSGGVPLRQLYEAVLRKFLNDPTYAKRRPAIERGPELRHYAGEF